MKNLLSLKHWQLFILIFICGIWVSPSPLKEIVNSIAAITFILWLYSVGVLGQKKIISMGLIKMNLRLFIISLIVLGAIFIAAFFSSNIESKMLTTSDFDLNYIISIAGGLSFLFSIFHVINFVAKTIAKVELQREVFKSDYLDNAMLLFFFPIGIWFLQRKINKLFAPSKN